MSVAIVADIRRSALCRILASPPAGLALATLLWSGNFVIGRALRDAIDPLELNFWRWLVALAALLPFTGAAVVRQWPLLRGNLLLVVALGLTGLAVPHACIYTALRTTTAVNALLLLNLTPLLVALGAWAFFGQAMRRGHWAGLALSMAGAVTLIVSGRFEALLGLESRRGDLWMLPAIASAAAHVLLLRRTPAGLAQGPLLAASAAAALMLMSPLLLWRGDLTLTVDARVLWGLAYIGILASALAFWLWNRGVAAVGPVRSAGYMFLMPLYAALLSFVLLGEAVQAWQLVGGALVLLGLWFARLQRRCDTTVGHVEWPTDGACCRLLQDGTGCVQVQHRRGEEPLLRTGPEGHDGRRGHHRQGQQAGAQARAARSSDAAARTRLGQGADRLHGARFRRDAGGIPGLHVKRILLDTHAFLWWVEGDRSLPARALAAIADPDTDCLLSMASAWEIAIKVALGKLKLAVPVRRYIVEHVAANGFRMLDIGIAHVGRIETLEKHHGDPFDRLLVAQALEEAVPIVTADPVFRKYGVRRIWR